MADIALNLSKMTIAEKIQLATNVHTALTGNANVPTPNPTLAAYQTMIDEAQAGVDDYEAEKDVLQNKLNVRDQKIATLEAGTRTQAATVQAATGGDAVKIETTGFSVKATPAPVGVPTAVLNLVLTAGDNEGTIDYGHDPVRGAKSYEVQTSIDPVSSSSWTYKTTAPRSSGTLTGFTSGSKIWVKVRAIGSAGPGPWSDPATKTVP